MSESEFKCSVVALDVSQYETCFWALCFIHHRVALYLVHTVTQLSLLYVKLNFYEQSRLLSDNDFMREKPKLSRGERQL